MCLCRAVILISLRIYSFNVLTILVREDWFAIIFLVVGWGVAFDCISSGHCRFILLVQFMTDTDHPKAVLSLQFRLFYVRCCSIFKC